MDTSSEEKCNCRNASLESSKDMSSDSDIFYDIRDDEDNLSMPKSSNRSRTPQNDRNRDHTNLKLEPNIEAPAGSRQQPAGQRQKYQAKDKHDEENYHDDGNNGNNEYKEQFLSLKNNLTQKGSCLCSNVSQDGLRNISSEAVKLSFSMNTRADLQGSYECFCEERENKSCHKFWCQRNEVSGDDKKTVEDSPKAFQKWIKIKDDETCSQHTIFDAKPTPAHKYLYGHKSSIDSCSCSDPISSELENSTHPSSKNLNKLDQRRSLNHTEDLCQYDDFENSERYSKSLKPNLSESSPSVGAGLTSVETMDENVIQLLKSIFDVLQTMRKEQLHLGPIAARNIDIHLDEPLNGLPPPPTPTRSRSSLECQKHLQKVYPNFESPQYDDLVLEEESRKYINSENSLAILEPPERDVVETSSRSQRLIPVDMDLLRTDEDLVWEPEIQREEEEGKIKNLEVEDYTHSSAQFRRFAEEEGSESIEELQNLNLKWSSSKEAEGYYEQRSKTSTLNGLSDRKDEYNQSTLLKSEASPSVQVNLVSLQNLNSTSPQFPTLPNSNQLEDWEPQGTLITKLDVGTDCPDFENDEGHSIKSYHYSQESNQPSQNQAMSQFIESILFDLKAMESFRKNNSHWQNCARLSCSSAIGGWQRPPGDLSYPVSIETVQELGANSLFVKWRVQNVGNIGGYEIFLDGHLTNRYYNCIHRAAVICDVDLRCPHTITLRANPILPQMTSCSCSSTSNAKRLSKTTTTTTHPEASCPQSDGSVWYPSVYHFEPNPLSSAPINAVLY